MSSPSTNKDYPCNIITLLFIIVLSGICQVQCSATFSLNHHIHRRLDSQCCVILKSPSSRHVRLQDNDNDRIDYHKNSGENAVSFISRRDAISRCCNMGIAPFAIVLTSLADSSIASEDTNLHLNSLQSGYSNSINRSTEIGDYRFFIAGGSCAAISHGITTPLDVIKTKVQAEPEKFGKGLVLDASGIIQEYGPSVLFKGIIPTFVGYGIEGALKFGIYEALKPAFISIFSFENLTISSLFASIISGSMASIVLCPIEKARIKTVVQKDYSKGFLLGGLQRLLGEEGLLPSLSGIGPMLTKQIPYTIAKQVSFDAIATFLYSQSYHFFIPNEEFKAFVSISSAFLASICACVASHPGDVILTECYGNDHVREVDKVIRTIYNADGIGGFTRGFNARVYHVSTIVTAQLIIYDTIKQLLGLPATGR